MGACFGQRAAALACEYDISAAHECLLRGPHEAPSWEPAWGSIPCASLNIFPAASAAPLPPLPGLLPIVKEVIEILFQEGLLKVGRVVEGMLCVKG